MILISSDAHMTSHRLKKAMHSEILGLDVVPNSKQHKLGIFPSGPPESNPSLSPRVETVDCGDEAASWLSDFLGQPCRLIRQSPDFTRGMKKRPSGGTHISISPVLPVSCLFTLGLSVIAYMMNAVSHVLL